MVERRTLDLLTQIGVDLGWPPRGLNFFSLFLLRNVVGRHLVAKNFPMNAVVQFCTLKIALKTPFFGLQLLRTTEMVYLSWKFHLALVLTIPGS